jgi:ATP-dependent DNA helicase RecQ
VDKTIALLSLEAPAPIAKQGTKWQLTAATLSEGFWARAERLTALRRDEHQKMQEYVDLPFGDHMGFLIGALDGDPGAVTRPGGMPRYGLKGIIPQSHRAQAGKALCVWGDAGWGGLVRQGKYYDGNFSDDLVAACVKMIHEWSPSPAPAWVTCVPSLRHPNLVPNFAQRLAAALGLPFHMVIAKTDEAGTEDDGKQYSAGAQYRRFARAQWPNHFSWTSAIG